MLVLQFGLNPAYVLDEIEWYEINSLMKFSFYRHKEDWEQTRLIAYMTAQTHSSKKLKLQNILKFQWEKDSQNSDTQISKADIERLTREAEELEKLFSMGNMSE